MHVFKRYLRENTVKFLMKYDNPCSLNDLHPINNNELKKLKAKIHGLTSIPAGMQHAWAMDKEGIDKAIKISENGQKIFVGYNKDGYYFAS